MCTYLAAPTPAPADETLADAATPATRTPAAMPTPIAIFAFVPNVFGAVDGGIDVDIDDRTFTVVVPGTTRCGM